MNYNIKQSNAKSIKVENLTENLINMVPIIYLNFILYYEFDSNFL